MAYSKNPRLIDKETDGGLLLFDTESGRMLELNATAKLLWKSSGTVFDMEGLRKIIEANCAPASGVEKDLADFIKTALKHNLVSEDGKDEVRETRDKRSVG
jgi:hypothetical protein